MPWKESCIVNERVKFIADVLKGELSTTVLCQQYGIARKTGYKWMERFQEAGPAGLEDLGRRSRNCAHATPEAVVQEILKLRYQASDLGRAQTAGALGANERRHALACRQHHHGHSPPHRVGPHAEAQAKGNTFDLAVRRNYRAQSGVVHGF
jgi:transposase